MKVEFIKQSALHYIPKETKFYLEMGQIIICHCILINHRKNLGNSYSIASFNYLENCLKIFYV